MKSKILSSVLLTLFLSLALVSAATFTISTSTPTTLSKTNTQASFVITNPSATTLNLSVVLPTTISDGVHTITIAPTSALVFNNLGTGQSATVSLNYVGDTVNFKTGNFASTIVVNAVDSANSANTLTQNIPLTFSSTFCKSGDNSTSDLSISDVTINNNDNSDDTEWRPLDEITIKVKVENTGSEKVTSVNVELGLLDTNGKNVIGNMDNLDNKKISLSTISDGKSKTAEFKFNVPVDFDEESYQLVVKAYKSGSEATICTSQSSDLGNSFYESISGTRETDENKQVVLHNIVFSPETAQCGDKVQISGEVVNIGDTDYSDKVKVTMYNKELGVSQEKVINEDLNQGDSVTVDFDFDVPATAKEKLYVLEFRTYYDYDQVYGIVSDQIFSQSITVKGNCNVVSTTPKLQITAQLDPQTPDAIAGKQVIVNARLNNLGSSNNYAISVYGNSGWSSLVSIDPQSLTLNQGQSGDVNVVLNLDKEATGDKQFTIRAVSGNQTVEQNVVLSITPEQSTVSSSAFVENIKANWFIYVIVLVNIILIIAIILVIRRMLSPRKRSFD